VTTRRAAGLLVVALLGGCKDVRILPSAPEEGTSPLHSRLMGTWRVDVERFLQLNEEGQLMDVIPEKAREYFRGARVTFTRDDLVIRYADQRLFNGYRVRGQRQDFLDLLLLEAEGRSRPGSARFEGEDRVVFTAGDAEERLIYPLVRERK
jgi:hypothetical protein